MLSSRSSIACASGPVDVEHETPGKTRQDPAKALVLWSIGVSVVLLLFLGAMWLASGSVLALAQASDSLADSFTAAVMLVALSVGAAKADDNHPFGHHGAQPIAALVVAVLTGVLAVEVMRSAIGGLVAGELPTLHWAVAAAFAAKVVAKGSIAWFATRTQRMGSSPVVRALGVDARNDVAVSTLALIGFACARFGHPSVDLWLAIPLAGWIGFAGIQLATENISLLMGEAPDETIQAELRQALAAIDGVQNLRDFRARHYGTAISVRATIRVDSGLSVGEAQAIAEAAEHELLTRPDVSDIAVTLVAN